MHLQDYVHKYRPDIISTIEKTFEDRSDIFYSKEVSKKLKNFATSGKTLRGIIVCLSAEMYGKSVDESVFATAAAIEVNHSGLLVHDDIIDRDELRRGEKTLSAQYSQIGSEYGVSDPPFFGSSVAICVGDVAFFVAAQMLSVLPPEQLKKALSLFYTELEHVALAEMYEFVAGQKNENLTEDTIENIYKYKTARYTFSLPLVLGSILAKAPESELAALEKLGTDLGIIFQIKDDEIGLLGNEKVIGKPVGSDIRENKKTLIRSQIFKSCSQEEEKKLNSIFGREDIGIDELAYVRDIVKKYKISDKINSQLSKKAKDVTVQIDSLHADTSYKKILQEFVTYNLERAY